MIEVRPYKYYCKSLIYQKNDIFKSYDSIEGQINVDDVSKKHSFITLILMNDREIKNKLNAYKNFDHGYFYVSNVIKYVISILHQKKK